MRITIITMTVALFMIGTLLNSCQSSAKKVENAQDKLEYAKDKMIEANMELNQAIKDSIQQFKIESEEKISNYEKNITEIKVKLATKTRENKGIYEQKLATLEQKNSEMKKKLADYKDEEQYKWEIFKTEFNRDMDELSKAINDLTVKNVK